MSMEKTKKNKLESINGLLVEQGSTPHDIALPVGGEELLMTVWVKELSFIEMQRAVKEVMSLDAKGEVSLDLAGYWQYMLLNCIEKTDPELSKSQILALKPKVAARITAILPQPDELMTGPLVMVDE